MKTISSKFFFASMLLCFVCLLCVEETYQKRGGGSRGGGSRRGGFSSWGRRSTSGGSSYKKPTKLSKYAKYAIVGTAVGVPAYSLLRSRRSYSQRRFPNHDDDFAYFSSSRLASSFSVNRNEYWTPFLLVLDKDNVINCLVVPSSSDSSQCSSLFQSHVTKETQFLLPNEFNSTSSETAKSKNEIALCCRSAGLLPNAVSLLIIVIASFIYNF